MRKTINLQNIYCLEPTGRQLKYWFVDGNKRFLYKEATIKKSGVPTYNDVSECMSMEVAKLIGIPTAEYQLCQNGNKNAVITEDFLDNEMAGPKKEEFYDGVDLINNIDPGFKNGGLINPKTHQYYTVDLILQSIEEYGLIKEALEMMLFDALIANRDRNPSNYGIIINHQTNKVRFAPLYDSCTSLGISMVDHRLDKCLDKMGIIVDDEHFNLVIHHHIIGKVTIERHFQHKEIIDWNRKKFDENFLEIELEKQKLLPLLNGGEISREYYHKRLFRIGKRPTLYDITTAEYQQLVSYLTLFYPDEINSVMESIKNNITEENIDKIFQPYEQELPIQRMTIAKKIVLERAKWMTDFYQKNKEESRGKLL